MGLLLRVLKKKKIHNIIIHLVPKIVVLCKQKLAPASYENLVK